MSTFPTGTVSREGLSSRTFPAADGDAETTSAQGATAASRPVDGPAAGRDRASAGGDRAAPVNSPTTDTGSTPDADRGGGWTGGPRGAIGGAGMVDDAAWRPPSERAGGDGLRADGSPLTETDRRLADLERENERLRTALDDRERELQDVIDRYERLLNESRRPGRRRRQTTGRAALGRVASGVDRAVSGVDQAVSDVAGRLSGLLSAGGRWLGD